VTRAGAVRRQAPEVRAGVAGTALVHCAALVFLVAGVKPPAPMAPVYAVELVAAPRPVANRRPAPEAVTRPVEPPDAGPPTPKQNKVSPVPTRTTPKPKTTAPKQERPPVEREPAPRSETKAEPAPGETPSTGTDAVNIKTPGLQFAYPEYLRNIVAQVYRRWDRPGGNQALRAEVSFFILRDGTVRDIRFVTPSGNFSFDLSAQGAIEAAGNARAFGPLPDGYEADVLPVSFFFTPRTGS